MKISVVIPAYNAQNYILSCLNSLANQTYKDIEIIVVNDGSTDETRLIVEQFIKKHSELDIQIINIKNGGLANARNVGMQYCTGELYQNLDSDDYITEDTYEKVVNIFLQDKNLDLCFYGYKCFTEPNSFYDYYTETKIFVDKPISGIQAFKLRELRKIWLCQGNVVYKRKLITDNKILNVPTLNQGEDMYFISRCLLYAKYVFNLKSNNFCHMIRNESMNHQAFDTSFYSTLKLLNLLEHDVHNMEHLNDDEKEEILLYIHMENINQYFGILKRMVLVFNYKEFKSSIQNFDFEMDTHINKELLNLLSLIRKIELHIFNMSPYLYYNFVKVYRRIKHYN